MQFVHSVLSQDRAVTVSTVQTFDLPVNPFLGILFTVKALNDTGTLTDYTLMAALLNQVSKVEILYKGQAIVSGSLTDLAILNWLLHGRQPWEGNFVKTNNDVRYITVPIFLSRKAYDPMELFPATRKGELQLQITYAAAQTGIDNVVEQIEQIEVLDAAPERFLKYTTLTKTPSSTGWHDVDLPIGNKLLGCLLYGTTVPTGASYNATVGQVKVLRDNVEYGYSMCNWESLNGALLHRSGAWALLSHMHRLDSSAGAEQDTGEMQELVTKLQHYGYLDYDPNRDGMYALNTSGHARVNLRINQEPAADAMRALPVELMQVGGGN